MKGNDKGKRDMVPIPLKINYINRIIQGAAKKNDPTPKM